MNSDRNKPFSLIERVKECRNSTLKNRLRTLILSRGKTEPEFYKSIGLSKQYWYKISWGIWKPTKALKVKIAQALDVDSSVIWGDLE